MPVSAAERRFVLDRLTGLAVNDIRRLWRAAEQLNTDTAFAAYIAQAFPDVVAPYEALAAQFSATAFENDFPTITTPAIEAAPMAASQLSTSAQWALTATGTAAIDRMAGTAQRAIYLGDRDTTTANANRHGMRWVRVARPDACAFCRLLASRTANGDTYSGAGVERKINPDTKKPYRDGRMTTVVAGRQRGSRKQGSEYHDHCHCTAKAIPSGEDPMDYLSATEPQFADLAAQWMNEYNKAVDAAKSGGVKNILKEWRTFGDDIS